MSREECGAHVLLAYLHHRRGLDFLDEVRVDKVYVIIIFAVIWYFNCNIVSEFLQILPTPALNFVSYLVCSVFNEGLNRILDFRLPFVTIDYASIVRSRD